MSGAVVTRSNQGCKQSTPGRMFWHHPTWGRPCSTLKLRDLREPRKGFREWGLATRTTVMDTTPQTESATPASGWEFQFTLGRRLITLTLPRHLLIALLLGAFTGYLLGGQSVGAAQRRQSERVAALELRASELERSLESKQAERDELAVMVDTRLDELADDLQDRERELARLWSLVGRPPLQLEQRSPLASRSGQRPVLGLERRYQELRSRLHGGQPELRQLSTVARDIRKKQQAELAKRVPNIVPCAGEMTSGFGSRLHPVYGVGRQHNGCDFTADYGTPIKATASGQVVHADWLGGYGLTVEIDHGQGLKTLYAHCESLAVKKGQSVRKGQVIGAVGTTGLSSGPHCHYEVHKDGKPVDPLSYLPPGTSKRLKAQES